MWGKAFVDESNLAYAQAYTLVNVRGGIETGALAWSCSRTTCSTKTDMLPGRVGRTSAAP
jgi:hypothetical protein